MLLIVYYLLSIFYIFNLKKKNQSCSIGIIFPILQKRAGWYRNSAHLTPSLFGFLQVPEPPVGLCFMALHEL